MEPKPDRNPSRGTPAPAPEGPAEIQSLPLSKVFRVAWRGIRVRMARSLLVVGGIILAITFLTYILCADGFVLNVAARGSAALVEKLSGAGFLQRGDDADLRVQTRWTVGLALLISFVGIVNAMLMSVSERFREIGTMKCLGALDGFVLRLFLIESALEGVAGAGIGVLAGAVFAYGEGLSTYGAEVWSLLPAAQLARMLALCFASGLALTVLGALYPAYRAARMTPVVALRSEV
jgi:hypothetical protein